MTDGAIPEPFNLSGRHALVTGAGSPTGIGFACARILGSLGAAVTVTSMGDRIHDRASELRELNIEAEGFAADLTVVDDAIRLADLASARMPVTVLVNNAGMVSQSRSPSSGRLEDLTVDVWRAELDRDVTTAFLVTKAISPQMISSSWGRIVNVSSVTGVVAAMQGEVAYAAGKAALAGLTRALALDLAASGVTVNAVAPGWIETSSSLPHEVELGPGTPVGRMGTPEEVGFVVASLCSPGAAYITGQVIVIDGGNTIAEERVTWNPPGHQSNP